MNDLQIFNLVAAGIIGAILAPAEIIIIRKCVLLRNEKDKLVSKKLRTGFWFINLIPSMAMAILIICIFDLRKRQKSFWTLIISSVVCFLLEILIMQFLPFTQPPNKITVKNQLEFMSVVLIACIVLGFIILAAYNLTLRYGRTKENWENDLKTL